jgi:hypothetical protein
MGVLKRLAAYQANTQITAVAPKLLLFKVKVYLKIYRVTIAGYSFLSAHLLYDSYIITH